MKKSIQWIAGLSVLGWLDSVWLLILHSYSSLGQACAINATIHCDVLKLSQYSQWLGIPVPIFSGLFYGLLVAIAFSALRSKSHDLTRPMVYLWLLSWLGIASTIYMAVLSLAVLKMLCPYCFLLYVISLLIWGIGLKGLRSLDSPWGHLVRYDLTRMHRSRWVQGFIVISIMVLGFSYFLFKQSGHVTGEIKDILTSELRTLGPSTASTTIVEFSDFECPFCKVAADMMKEVQSNLSESVRVIYKFYPLDASCNYMGGLHKNSCRASFAALCAGVQGKFWPYHDHLFEHQLDLNDARFYEIAKTLALDLGRFDRCFRSDSTLKEIQKDISEGTALGVQGTPTLFINGRKYSGPLTTAEITNAIRQGTY